MLPRIQSLPSAAASRQALRTNVSRISGRHLSTARRTVGGSNGILSSHSSLRARKAAVPIVLGSVASTRNLSWPSMPSMPSIPYWSNKTPTPPAPVQEIKTPEQAAESATAAAEQANPQSVPVDAITPPPTSTTDPNPGLEAISDLVNSQSAADILTREENIGYLSSLGLDFGWGPSSVMQWTLEHIHVWGGIGWGGSIIATAILVRVVMFWPQVKATKLAANMKKMQADPRHTDAVAKMKECMRNGDREGQQQNQALMGLLRKEHDAPATGLIWSLLPVPFSFGMFRVVSGMTYIPVPSLEWSGMGWFTDLTLSDPYFLLPGIATALMVFSIKRNAANSPKSQQDMANKMVYVLTPVMIIGTSYLSAAVNLMGLAFGGATLVTTLLLNNPSVRAAFSIPPLEKPAAPAAVTYSAPRGVITPEAAGEAGKLPQAKGNWKQSIQDSVKYARNALDKQTQNMPGQGSAEDRAERRRRENLKAKEQQRRESEKASFQAKYKGKGGR